jgi:hypothetical protein
MRYRKAAVAHASDTPPNSGLLNNALSCRAASDKPTASRMVARLFAEAYAKPLENMIKN